MIADILTPPHSTDAEQAVLGAAMLDAQSDRVQKVFSFLTSEMFYSRQHQVIYGAMRDMNRANQVIDLLTVSERLENEGRLENCGGFGYLASIQKNTPSSANVIAYANFVKDKSIERLAIEQANKILEVFYTPSSLTTAQKLEQFQALSMLVDEKTKSSFQRGARALGDVMEDWLDEVDRRFDKDNRSRGLSTGIDSLDRLLEPKGLVKGALFVIGARPKMGKTTLYSQMAINCATRENLPAILFSLEMPDKQIFERMIGQHSGVNTDIFYRGADDDNQFSLANGKALELVNTNNLFIDDTPGISLSHIVSESRRIKREKGKIGLVMVDYLTLMTGEKADRNDLSFGIITKGLKNLAKELGCVVVLLTQLNRQLEQRVNKRPLPSDSRDTGQIEQDCDYWLGIYREGAYDENVNQQDTELLLRLNRHGKTGVVYTEQRNGAIYDVDQIAAQKSKEQSQTEQPKRYAKKGGF